MGSLVRLSDRVLPYSLMFKCHPAILLLFVSMWEVLSRKSGSYGRAL
jgi:hypothetical protein